MVSADPIYTVSCHRSWVFHFGHTVVLISDGMISLMMKKKKKIPTGIHAVRPIPRLTPFEED